MIAAALLIIVVSGPLVVGLLLTVIGLLIVVGLLLVGAAPLLVLAGPTLLLLVGLLHALVVVVPAVAVTAEPLPVRVALVVVRGVPPAAMVPAAVGVGGPVRAYADPGPWAS